MSDPSNPQPPPEGAPAGVVAEHPKAFEVRATAEFLARLREVTPRTGVVSFIVAANVLVFVAMGLAGVSWMSPTVADLVKWGGNYGPRTLSGQPWRILTGAFLHAGLMHIGFNMFALASSGLVIERIFGRARLAAIYLCAAVTGGVASVAVHPQIVSVGASGAIFGLYGALGGFLLRERGGIPAPVVSRLGRVAGSFVIYNVLYGFAQPAIDNSAHLGGLAGGVLAGAWLARPLVPGRAAAPGRVAAAVVLAALAVVVVPRVLPVVPDWEATIKRFTDVETQTNEVYKKLMDRSEKGELTNDDFAAGLERDVLPPLRAARAALMAPQRWTPEQRALLGRLDKFNEARERAWTLLANANRTMSPDDLAAAKDAQADAERLLDELTQKH